MSKKERLQNLFQEIGSPSSLRKILEDFYNTLSKDILVGFFFDGKNLSHIIDQQTQFLLKAMGQAQEYDGKTPGQAHRQLPPILKGHFDRRLVVLRETLEKYGLSSESVKTWISFENEFRKFIVSKESVGRRG